MSDNELLTIRPGDLIDDVEVAAILAVSPVTLRNWRCKGKGPRFRKIGERTVRYLRADVLEFAAPAPAPQAAA